jgi:hypothetical protein
MEDFKNHVFGRIRERDYRYTLALGRVKCLIEHAPKGCQLLEYCIRQLASEITHNGFAYFMEESVEGVTITEASADLLAKVPPGS